MKILTASNATDWLELTKITKKAKNIEGIAASLDDFLLAGWGAANQLPETNYVRKSWSVIARIFSAATPEQLSTVEALNIEELKDAGKSVLEELWNLGLMRIPSVNRYTHKLSELLSATIIKSLEVVDKE